MMKLETQRLARFPERNQAMFGGSGFSGDFGLIFLKRTVQATADTLQGPIDTLQSSTRTHQALVGTGQGSADTSQVAACTCPRDD